MFTGLIEDIGIIKNKGNGTLSIDTELDGIKLGDSVSVNGVCLTASNVDKNIISFDVMPETIERTTLKKINIRDKVNLERALVYGGRVGGHLVSGHVEDVGVIQSIKIKNNARIVTVVCSYRLMNNIFQKGSIAIDGISLTVTETGNNYFKVSIIPETWNNTILCEKKIGAKVNIETDYTTKKKEDKKNSRITGSFLKENGFV
ncbi:MAG: riboflavin synthase [Elusimicrobiota bacterium]